MKPVYKHDCKTCVFLGSTTYKGRIYDLYVCSPRDMYPVMDTVIARWSSDGPDYMSGICFAKLYNTPGNVWYEPLRPLAVCYRLALEKGYKDDGKH